MTTSVHEQPRLHALDAMRAAALLLGICLHACLSFVSGGGAALWPIRDSQQSLTLSITVFVIHIFRMSVFFLVAGLLTRALLHRAGLADFCRNRAVRILVPLGLGWVACFVLVVMVVLWAQAHSHGGQAPSSLPPATAENRLNFLHLWFLYLLLWLYAIAVAARHFARLVDPSARLLAWADRALRATVSSRLGVVVLAIPVGGALALINDWQMWRGVPTPAYTLIPPAVPLFIYTGVFAIGWMLDRQRHLLAVLGDKWVINFFVGLAGALVCLSLALAEATKAAGGEAGFVLTRGEPVTLVYAAAYGLALIGWTLAFVGVGVKYLSRARASVRYVADASYWMYIAHFPLVMALQAALMAVDLHWAIKFLMINVIGFALLLISYHSFVRSTWVGLLLNGKRQPRGAILRG